MGQQGLDVRRACLRPSQLLGADFAVCRESYLEEAVEEEGDDDDLEAPSNAIKLSYDIARLCNVKITQAIQISQQDKQLGEKLRKETKRFMEIFRQTRFCARFSVRDVADRFCLYAPWVVVALMNF